MVDECRAARRASKKEEAPYHSEGPSDAVLSSIKKGDDDAAAAARGVSVSYEARGASEEKVVVPPCADDPNFLYKDKPGFDCAFVGKYKPEKCAKKTQDGAVAIGVAPCPVSCGMVEECRASSSSSSARSPERRKWRCWSERRPKRHWLERRMWRM